MRSLRLTDAVIIAALALLALRVASLTAPAAETDAEPSSFARVLSHARTNYVPPEITRTGSVPDKKPGDDAKGANPKASDPKPADPKAAIGPTTEAPPKPPAGFGPVPAASPSERALLERLGERRDALQQRAKEVEMRERLIENAERRVDQRINELKSLEEKQGAGGGEAKRSEVEAAALKNLVTMYETMKPKDAARVFDRLPHDVLVPVVVQMNPRKMAEVLALMGSDPAEKLTVALALRARGQEPRGPGMAAQALPANELPAIEPPARR